MKLKPQGRNINNRLQLIMSGRWDLSEHDRISMRVLRATCRGIENAITGHSCQQSGAYLALPYLVTKTYGVPYGIWSTSNYGNVDIPSYFASTNQTSTSIFSPVVIPFIIVTTIGFISDDVNDAQNQTARRGKGRSEITNSKMRLSGLQKEVVGLYRQCLREIRQKPEVQ